MIQIAIISNPRKLSGLLTKLVTGSYAYHIGFVDAERGKFYDMNLLFRRREWPHYPTEQVRIYPCPVEVMAADLEHQLDIDTDTYSPTAYLMFAIKRLWMRVLKLDRPSFKNDICSSKVEEILVKHGWVSPFTGFQPSPADFEKVLQVV